MAEINQVLKEIIDDSMRGFDLTDYRAGTVIALKPLKISITDRIIPEGDQLLLTEQVIEKKLNLKHYHQIKTSTLEAANHIHPIQTQTETELNTLIVIQEGLKVGDKVILLKVSKGEKYLVLSKIREKISVTIDKESNWKWE